MPGVILNYDVRKTTTTIHTELKTRLIQNYGYSETINANNGEIYFLPNTALLKVGIDAQQSAQEFLNACQDVGAIWEKYVANEYTYAVFDNQNP